MKINGMIFNFHMLKSARNSSQCSYLLYVLERLYPYLKEQEIILGNGQVVNIEYFISQSGSS